MTKAYLAEEIRNHLPQSTAPEWYRLFLEFVAIPNWQVFAIGLTVAQAFIGGAYILGYLVRPAALIGVLMSMGLLFAVGPNSNVGQSDIQFQIQATTMMIVVHLVLGWSGAGRCLGFDYYFYKRHRGIWW